MTNQFNFRGAAAALGNTKQINAWSDYGYPDRVEFESLYRMHTRNGIAKAGNAIPVDLCWKSAPRVKSNDSDDVTPWEAAFNKIAKATRLWKKLRAADLRQRVGRYGGVLVQVRGSLEQADWERPLANITDKQIVRFIPFYEDQMKVATFDENKASERYGFPLTYNYNEAQVGQANRDGKVSQPVTVHYSRVLVFAEEADDDTIFGVPANEAGFNDLLTMELVAGAGGQGFWKNASGKLHFDFRDPAAAPPTQEERDKQKEQIQDFASEMDKALATAGMEAKVLNYALADPDPYFRVALQSYSASVRIPANRLIGSVTGVLAGDKDDAAFLQTMQSRRVGFCAEMVESVAAWLIEHGVLPAADIVVEFDDLQAPGDKDKLELAEKMARINSLTGPRSGDVFTNEQIAQAAGWEYEPDDLIDPLPEGDDETDPE